MLNPFRPGYKTLTLRGIFLFTSIFFLVPIIKILSVIMGEQVFLSLRIVQLSLSILNILDIISIIALFGKAISTKNPFVIVVLILVFSLAVSGEKFGEIGQLILGIMSVSMAFDQILLDYLDPNKDPMDKYFTHYYES